MKRVKFGSRIKAARIAKRMTQIELAKALGYDSAQFVSLMERDQSKVPLAVFGRMVVILGMDPEPIIHAIVSAYRQQVIMEFAKGMAAQEAKGKNAKG